jgi:endonuclease/exonuclease/phosphatase family metal-dependent hydrolase
MARRPRLSPEVRLLRSSAEHLARSRNGVRALLVFLALILLLYGVHYIQQHRAAAPPPAASVDRIRIATWNLRKFGQRDRPGQHPPDLVSIARIIKESQFDLVAIQEVQQAGEEAAKLRRQLTDPWRLVLSERTGNNERFAFLYRSDRIELLDTPHFMPADEARTFDRAPFIATFKAGQFDFTLVTIHLSYTDTPRRRREAEALARFAKDLAAHASEKDVIVLGDFNEQHQHPNLNYFDAQGWLRLNTLATNLGSNEIYDNLLIDPAHTKEWTRLAGIIRFDETLYSNDDKRATDDVSDHRPAYADFLITGPDDD